VIIVTGGAGFIGSAIVWGLNKKGINDILVVDHLGNSDKWKNLNNLQFKDYVEKDEFPDILISNKCAHIEAIFHMGACSSTTEKDSTYLIHNNFEYTKLVAQYAIRKNIYFIYASSAATYGDGRLGFSDQMNIDNLFPLNPYGFSKQLFDIWAKRNRVDHHLMGFKFFNVYGPNEYHKGEMKSVVCKAYYQIKETGQMKLFKSYKDGFAHGEQKRDFIYIKDVVDAVLYAFDNRLKGLYNLGTGKARTFLDLVKSVFRALNLPEKIEFIEMPESIRNQYQYFTEADMKKFKETGYNRSFYSLEDGIFDYINNYLESYNKYLGNRKDEKV